MALVHVDGFEDLFFDNSTSSFIASTIVNLRYTEPEGTSTIFQRINNPFIYQQIIPFPNYGINGYTYILNGSKDHGFVTPLPNNYSSGILSFLMFKGSPATSSLAPNPGIMVSVRGNGNDIVALRYVSTQNAFPDSGYIMELVAGGVQIGTFLYPFAMFNKWARWSIVWDTTGPNITASLYRNKELILSGTGGTSGAGVPINSYRTRFVGGISSTSINGVSTTVGLIAYDSFTVWNDPVADLDAATSPHWIGCSIVSPDTLISSNDEFKAFSGTTITPTGFSEFLIDSNSQTGIFTDIYNASINVPVVMNYDIDSATKIIALSPISYIQGTGLVTATKKIISGSSQSNPVSTNVLNRTVFSPIFLKDPATQQDWELPTKVTILDPEGDGGFESGSTFADNGWQTSSTGQATWECGHLGAKDGERGAYISLDGGITDLNSVTLPASYSNVFLWKEFVIPEGVTQISVEFNFIGGNTAYSSYLWPALYPDGVNFSTSNSQKTPYKFWCLALDSLSPPSTFSSSVTIVAQLTNISYRYQQWQRIKTLPKIVNPGQTYRLSFIFSDSSGRTYIEGLAIDSVAIYGYSGSIANTLVNYTAT